MFIPIDQKLLYFNDVLLERALPTRGYLTAQQGEYVKPYTKLGISKVSYQKFDLTEDFKPGRGKSEGSYFYEGDIIGHVGFNKIKAPFNGFLVKEEKSYYLNQEERDYWLLSGVWGEVVDIVKDHSVLLRTQFTDLVFAQSTSETLSGEFIAFPNPDEILVREYMANLNRSMSNKIVYVGEFLSIETLKKAIEMDIAGLVAGGTDPETFALAKKNGVFVGLITGYGKVSVPPYVFDILKSVSSRLVFVNGGNKSLRIPSPEKFTPEQLAINKVGLKQLKNGIEVLVLQKPFFGKIGLVDRVSESSIFVKFPEKEEPFEVGIPNVLALA